MGLRSTLRALGGSVHLRTLRALRRAAAREAARVHRRFRQTHPYGRDAEPRCYLFLPLERRVIADQGLLAYFFDDLNLDPAHLVHTRIDTSINFNWGAADPAPGVPGEQFSARWVGTLDVGDGGNFHFKVTADSGVRLSVGGVTLVDHWSTSLGEGVSGDADGDRDVDLDDQGIWAANFTGSLAPNTGGKTKATGDFDGDGDADLDDQGIWAGNFTGAYNGGVFSREVDTVLPAGSLDFKLEFFSVSSSAQLKLEWDFTGDDPVVIPNSRYSLPDFSAAIAAQLPTTEGSALQFSAGYVDPSGGQMSATVDWGDGSTPQTVTRTPARTGATHVGSLTAAHAYADNGIYQATLTLHTPAGNKEVNFAVTIDNAPPTTAGLSGPTAAQLGQPVAFTLTSPTDASTADAAAGLRYSFATTTAGLADEYALAASNSGWQAPPFTSLGQHTVYARVFDKDGGVTQYTRTITITPPGRYLIGPDSVDRGRPYTVNVPTVTPTGYPIIRWAIDWGDNSDPDADGATGQTIDGTPSILTHVYTTASANGIPSFVSATANHADGSYVYPDLAVTVPSREPITS